MQFKYAILNQFNKQAFRVNILSLLIILVSRLSTSSDEGCGFGCDIVIDLDGASW